MISHCFTAADSASFVVHTRDGNVVVFLVNATPVVRYNSSAASRDSGPQAGNLIR
jgi:hypothetical protein